ncbi:hypothetical protein [Sporisorium scitamineum]|uniref:Uncharacterized protein n=1 Tax=Sporisorium scitamineum TaxID=49012 RepID=A0A0F7RZB0_9BASI|nr:hypothetical protein [Sporisorium scitamineum]
MHSGLAQQPMLATPSSEVLLLGQHILEPVLTSSTLFRVHNSPLVPASTTWCNVGTS